MPDLKEVRRPLNRHGKRALLAEERQRPQFLGEYEARARYDREKMQRVKSREAHLDAVRKRTKARNGIINNPRFR